MTTYPGRPDLKAPRTIADHGRQVTRAHARLDNVESIQSKQTADIATNTTAIGAVSGGTGGTAEQNFLGLLAVAAVGSVAGGDSTQADFLGNLAELANQGAISSTGVGTISGSGAVNNITNAEFNAVNTQLNSLITSYNALLSHLQSNGFMTP